MHNTLESHRLFPIIAWILIISFAGFVYFITVSVQAELNDIGDGVERLERELDNMKKQPPQP